MRNDKKKSSVSESVPKYEVFWRIVPDHFGNKNIQI
jgi:hypothetical protein